MRRRNHLLSPKKRPRRSQAGLTLIEILVVVTILGLLASIAGVVVVGVLGGAKKDTAKAQIHEFAKSLDVYKVKYNRYPTTQEGLAAMKTPPKGGAPIMDSIPHDPWDNEYVYVCPGQHNPSKFDIQSKGEDGVADSEDDVTNW